MLKRNPRTKQEAVLKATAVRSPLPAGNVIDSSLSSLPSPRGGGSGRGEGGRGHFIQPAIYCTTTWCFALKGLRTTRLVHLGEISRLCRCTKGRMDYSLVRPIRCEKLPTSGRWVYIPATQHLVQCVTHSKVPRAPREVSGNLEDPDLRPNGECRPDCP